MLRRIEISGPHASIQRLLLSVQRMEGVIGVRYQPAASVAPPGDLLTVDALAEAHMVLLRLLEEDTPTSDPANSVTITELRASINPAVRRALHQAESFCSWEEMQSTLSKQSNMTASMLAVLIVSGLLAGIGIANGAIHLVIAAMVVAPGFEPVVRVPLGIIANGGDWKSGLIDVVKAYTALLVGAFAAGWIMLANTGSAMSGSEVSTTAASLIRYWTAIDAPSVTVAMIGGIAGAILIATGRSLLTSGVMVALALIPCASIVGLAAAAGDWGLALEATVRWLIEVVSVVLGASGFWSWYRWRIDKRRSAF